VSEQHLKIYIEIVQEQLWAEKRPFVEEFALEYLYRYVRPASGVVDFETLFNLSNNIEIHRKQLLVFLNKL